jgi:hypothetical protein
MRAQPNQMSESRHSRRFVPMASASAEGQLSDLLDPDQLVRGVPLADVLHLGRHEHELASRSQTSIYRGGHTNESHHPPPPIVNRNPVALAAATRSSRANVNPSVRLSRSAFLPNSMIKSRTSSSPDERLSQALYPGAREAREAAKADSTFF